MGILQKTFQTLQDVTSLGGTWRLREIRPRFEALHQAYQRLTNAIALSDLEGREIADRLSIASRRAESLLKGADRILAPIGSMPRDKAIEGSPTGLMLMPRTSAALASLETFTPGAITGIGVGAGFASGLGSWGLVQVIGHASTGAAMVGLHGAAATSAGWAWFGGGSLAAGGGGMALGHILLPGVGSAIAIGVSTFLSHSQASKLESACEELSAANSKNTDHLAKITEALKQFREFESKVDAGNEKLSDALKEAHKELFRFSFLSKWWRYLRYRFGGSYYTSKEFIYVQRLAMVVDDFIASFSRGKA